MIDDPRFWWYLTVYGAYGLLIAGVLFLIWLVPNDDRQQ